MHTSRTSANKTETVETETSDKLLLIVIMVLTLTALYHMVPATLNLHQLRIAYTQKQLKTTQHPHPR